MKKQPPQQTPSAEHPGEASRAAASWRHFTAACITSLASKASHVVSDLSYRAPGSVFRKIIVDLCHRSFYCIHHLKDKNRNDSGDHLPEALLDDMHLNSNTEQRFSVPHRTPGTCSCHDCWLAGGGTLLASSGWRPSMSSIHDIQKAGPKAKNYLAQNVTSAKEEKIQYKPG